MATKVRERQRGRQFLASIALLFAGWLSRGDRCRWGEYVSITAYAEWERPTAYCL